MTHPRICIILQHCTALGLFSQSTHWFLAHEVLAGWYQPAVTGGSDDINGNWHVYSASWAHPRKIRWSLFQTEKGNQEKPSEITKLLLTWTTQQFITSVRSLWMWGSHRAWLGLQKLSSSLVPRNLLKLSPCLPKIQLWVSESVTVTVQWHPGWQERWVWGWSVKMQPASCWTCFPCVPQGSKH